MLFPKLRNVGYVSSFVTEKKKIEQSVIQVIQEDWTNGVSTRIVDSLAKQLGVVGNSVA